MTYFYYNEDFRSSIALGLYKNAQTTAYPGYHPNLLQDTETTLNPMGFGLMTTPSDSGELLEVVSTDASDVGRVIVLLVLDADGKEAIGVSLTNGLTPSIILIGGVEAPISRVNLVVNRGSVATVGDIIVRQKGGGTSFNGFKAEDQRSFCLIFTTPSNKKGLFMPAESTMNKATGTSDSVILRTKTRIQGGPWLNNGRWGLQKNGTSAFLFETYDLPEIPPFTDIMITAQASASGIDVTGRVPISLFPPYVQA